MDKLASKKHQCLDQKSMKNRSKIDKNKQCQFWIDFYRFLYHLGTNFGPFGPKLASKWCQVGSKLDPGRVLGASRSLPECPRTLQNPPKTLPKPQVANFDDFSSKNPEILTSFGRSGMDFWSQNTNHTIHQATNHPSLQA